MKIVLIGAASAQFGLGTIGDIFQSKALEGSHIALVDINAQGLQQVYEEAQQYIHKQKLNFSLSYTTNRAEALVDARFVIISIETAPRFSLWEQDWHIPQQYGFWQVYGENGGPGGIFHSLRILPPILSICEDIMKISPTAWVFNYSNPMTAIGTTVYRKYPQLKFVGLCHEIASLERYLPDMLDTAFEDLELQAAGLNHFSVLVSATYKSSQKDAYQDILQKAHAFFANEPGFSDLWAKYQKTGKINHQEGHNHRFRIEGQPIKQWADRGVFKEILTTYNLLPITWDSHIGEYIGWAHHSADHRGIKDFYALYKTMLSHAQRPQIEAELKERVVLVIEGILANSGYIEPAVNIPNDGYLPSLPQDIVVEVPAKIYANKIEGVSFPNYPRGFLALLRNYVGVYDLTAMAVLTKEKKYVLQALLACPQVHNADNAKELVDVMMQVQLPYLSYLQ